MRKRFPVFSIIIVSWVTWNVILIVWFLFINSWPNGIFHKRSTQMRKYSFSKSAYQFQLKWWRVKYKWTSCMPRCILGEMSRDVGPNNCLFLAVLMEHLCFGVLLLYLYINLQYNKFLQYILHTETSDSMKKSSRGDDFFTFTP